MNHQEWLNKRREGIGASDAPIIMGVSPWKTPHKLWEEKIFGAESISNSYMQRGNELEPIALQYFEEKIGKKLEAQVFLTSAKNKWMTATLDGYNPHEKVLVEIKCPGPKDHIIAMNGAIPEKYIPQLQHQLEVTGLDGMYYLSFDGKEGHIIEVLRDSKYIDKLLEKESEFYQCMLNLEPPKLMDADYINMEDNCDWLSLARAWQMNNEHLVNFEKEDKLLRDQLIKLANDRHAKGGGIKISKSECKGAVEYSKIPQLQGIDVEPYRKKSFTKWRFSAIK